MRDMVKPAVKLFVICFVVALCLALVNSATKEVIAERTKAAGEEQRRQVIKEAESFEELEGWKENGYEDMIGDVYAAYKGDELLGYVFTAAPKGYGGEMKVIVGISKHKEVLGVAIGDNSETPGLGSKVAEDKFKGQYEGKSIEKPFEVVKGKASGENEIEAVSGATITSKAVTDAVRSSAELAEGLLKDGGE